MGHGLTQELLLALDDPHGVLHEDVVLPLYGRDLGPLPHPSPPFVVGVGVVDRLDPPPRVFLRLLVLPEGLLVPQYRMRVVDDLFQGLRIEGDLRLLASAHVP